MRLRLVNAFSDAARGMPKSFPEISIEMLSGNPWRTILGRKRGSRTPNKSSFPSQAGSIARFRRNASLDPSRGTCGPSRRRRHEEPRNRSEAEGEGTFHPELYLPHLREVGGLQPRRTHPLYV